MAIEPGELHNAAECGDLDTVRRLLASGADPNEPESGVLAEMGWSPLMFAARHTAVVRLLLEAGADATFATRHGESVVMTVARLGSGEGLDALYGAGADLHQADQLGDNALMEAAGAGNQETVEFLLQHGLPIDGTTVSGATALMAAARRGRTHTVELLVRAGADPNRRIQRGKAAGRTALDLAEEEGHQDVVAFLRRVVT